MCRCIPDDNIIPVLEILNTFQRIVFAFASEDTDVRRSELEKIVHSDIAGRKRKILVIEDNLLNQEMLCTILQDKYEIITAENGEIGFELLEQNYRELSVILLDMQIPDAQGIFHFDLTADRLFATNGVSTNLDQFENAVPVDSTVEQIASFIPDDRMKSKFLTQFRREAMISAYQSGKNELRQELLLYYADRSIRWTRMTCRFIANPNNGHLEGILYGMDISRERAYEERIAQAEQVNETLLERSKRDPLTGLYTKTAFADLMQDMLDSNSCSTFALIFLDLDHFKEVNDTLGHLTGDHVLRSTARILQRLFDEECYLSRFGGDEYCVYFPNCTHDSLTDKLEKLRLALARTITYDGASVTSTTSIGTIYCTGPIKELTPLLRSADEALYTAKQNGRNQYCIRDLPESSL